MQNNDSLDANPHSKLTQKELLGIALEKWVYAILRILFPAKLGYRIKCPDWDGNYSNDHGVDFRVYYGKKEILALECKNWRQRTLKYGSDVAQSEVIDRLEHVGANLKILLITFLDVFYTPALTQIKQNGIELLETQKLIGHRDYKTQLFYTVKSAITKLIKQHHDKNRKPRTEPVCSSYTNTNTNSSSGVSRTLNNYIPTAIEESKEDYGKPLRPLINEWLAYRYDFYEGDIPF